MFFLPRQLHLLSCDQLCWICFSVERQGYWNSKWFRTSKEASSMQLLVVIQPLRPALDQSAVPKKKVSKKSHWWRWRFHIHCLEIVRKHKIYNLGLGWFRLIMKGGSWYYGVLFQHSFCSCRNPISKVRVVRIKFLSLRQVWGDLEVNQLMTTKHQAISSQVERFNL